jgi:hypothetical protein
MQTAKKQSRQSCPHCGDRRHQHRVTEIDEHHVLWTCANPKSFTRVFRGPRDQYRAGILQLTTIEGCGSYTVKQ